MEPSPLPPLVEAKRRLCGELLASAAVHSAISDELVTLDELEQTRPLTEHEQQQRTALRSRKLDVLRRHDAIDHRLRRLTAHLRSSTTESRTARR